MVHKTTDDPILLHSMFCFVHHLFRIELNPKFMRSPLRFCIPFFCRYLLCLLLFNLAACSSMQTVNVDDAMRYSSARGVDHGSLVQVNMLDGRSVKVRVTETTPDGLGGSKGFYRFEEMKSLKVENPAASNKDNTWAWVLGILGVAALVALVANADSVSICSGTPCPKP